MLLCLFAVSTAVANQHKAGRVKRVTRFGIAHQFQRCLSQRAGLRSALVQKVRLGRDSFNTIEFEPSDLDFRHL